jgi:hypothetical protein
MAGRALFAVGAALLAVGGCSTSTFRTGAPAPADDGGAGDTGALPNDGSVCGDTSGDSNHCGACNHSCLGGTCAKGRCQPVTLLKSADLPSTLALDGSRFYVGLQGGSGGVLECAQTGCAADAGPALPNFFAGGITVDKDAVYVAKFEALGEIFRSVKGTTTKSVIAQGDLSVLLRNASEGHYIASDGSGVNPPGITRFDPTSATTTLVRTANPIRGIAFTNDRVLWTEPAARTVFGARRDGTTPIDSPEVFLSPANASGAGAWGIAVVGNRVFVAGHLQGNLVRCAFGATCSIPESLAVGGEPSLLVADDPGQKLYWYDTTTKAIRSCEVSLCEKTQADLVTGIPDVFDLAVGTDAVYYTVRATSGGVYRIAK